MLTGEQMLRSMVEAGVIGSDVRRVVIDVQPGHVVMMYVERFADQSLLRVTSSLEGAQISYGPEQDE
jgi:hypothetical protein